MLIVGLHKRSAGMDYSDQTCTSVFDNHSQELPIFVKIRYINRSNVIKLPLLGYYRTPYQFKQIITLFFAAVGNRTIKL